MLSDDLLIHWRPSWSRFVVTRVSFILRFCSYERVSSRDAKTSSTFSDFIEADDFKRVIIDSFEREDACADNNSLMRIWRFVKVSLCD